MDEQNLEITETVSEVKAKGGFARAKSLSATERSEIAKKGANARWHSHVPQASHDGELKLASKLIYCAVLPTGKRLLLQSQFLAAIGRNTRPKGGMSIRDTFDELPFFLSADQLKPFISEDLMASTTPIAFKTKSGRLTMGYDAELLPKVCEVYLQYRDESLKKKNIIPKRYDDIIKACDVLMRGLAHVGIIALVDEATGYERDKAREAYQEILTKFIAKELRKWVKTFPNEFYEQICRLKGLKLLDINKRPRYFGCLTNNLVYARLAPGVLKELKRVIPKDSKGRAKYKFTRRLSEDIGHPRLRELLASEITLMRIFDDGKWDEFEKALNRAVPKYLEMPLFDQYEEAESQALTVSI
ncbi:MAG: hypothetical protein QOF02_3721 [Blastocatellia bacterium]|jgi:hypothetical protein|nr:hypothetical protein [Blastocatellia bacterium]